MTDYVLRAATVLEQYNRIEEAKEFYARGLQHEPNNKVFLFYLIPYLFQIGTSERVPGLQSQRRAAWEKEL